MTVKGLDVSSYQGSIDWSAVKAASYQFAFMKATEGDGSWVDPQFAGNWAGAKAAGLIRGAYYFSRPDLGNTPQAEVDGLLAELDKVGGLEPGDLVAMDLEKGSGNLAAFAQQSLDYLKSKVGFNPVLYTGGWFAGPHDLENDPGLSEFGLWDGAYISVMPAPLPGWQVLALWQFTSSGEVPGISVSVDLDVFDGDLTQLLKYGKPGGTAPAPAPFVPISSHPAAGTTIGVRFTGRIMPGATWWTGPDRTKLQAAPVGDEVTCLEAAFDGKNWWDRIANNGQPGAWWLLDSQVDSGNHTPDYFYNLAHGA